MQRSVGTPSSVLYRRKDGPETQVSRTGELTGKSSFFCLSPSDARGPILYATSPPSFHDLLYLVITSSCLPFSLARFEYFLF